MITLRFNGGPLPASLTVGLSYQFEAQIDGADTLPTSWQATTSAGLVASGAGSVVQFRPASTFPHTLTVRALNEYGLPVTYARTFNVTAREGSAEAGVKWERLSLPPGLPLRATVQARDSYGRPPASVQWTLYRNNVAVDQGSGTEINYTGTAAGLYRVRGTAVCDDGTRLQFDSTLLCGSTNTVRHTLPVPDFGGSLVYLGAVYTQNVACSGGVASHLPYQLASQPDEVFLLPGTTHWCFDLDPAASQMEDDVVVRTAKGNWCLRGAAGGLSGEPVGYDYACMPEYIPAPLDCRLPLVMDVYKVQETVFAGSNLRLRIRCYRQLPSGVYRYERCLTHSQHPGGEGRRARRWAGLVTGMRVQTDVSSGLDRLGSGGRLVAYAAADVTSVPQMELTTTGAPHPVPGHTGAFYTDSNLVAYYEAAGHPELAAQAVAAIEQVRPCVITLTALRQQKPVLHNRVKRLTGRLSLFLLDGYVLRGSTVHVRVLTRQGLAAETYTYVVGETVYANQDSTLVRVGGVDVDLSDYHFAETGLALEFTVDESTAETSSPPEPLPTPVTSPDYLYTPVWSRTVSFDGACYTQPEHVPVFEQERAVIAVPEAGCHAVVCGPRAIYCYTALDNPSVNVLVPQPYGFPAPYVAEGHAPARCFGDPRPVAVETSGTVALWEYDGTSVPPLMSYSGSNYCGLACRYDACQSAYAPCAARDCSIVVVYPAASSPHPSLAYASRCYTFNGTVTDYGNRRVVPVVDTEPVVDCMDPVCTQFDANGSVVVYNDRQTGLEVPVLFTHLDTGTAHYGVAPAKIDDWADGLVSGRAVTNLKSVETLLLTASGTGRLELRTDCPGRKQWVRERAGVRSISAPVDTRGFVDVQPGDRVLLRVADAYQRLPLHLQGCRIHVSWQPVPRLPRHYDSATLPVTGQVVVRALGFCPYTEQGDYVWFGSLPQTVAAAGPVNPDTVVTVAGSGAGEYLLLTARAEGDANLWPLSVPPYSGQALDGPLTFRFYAARTPFGAHGEMDVWLDVNGTFPGYLGAGRHASVVLTGTAYRRTVPVFTSRRESFAVLPDAAAAASRRWPAALVALDGQVISVLTDQPSLTRDGKVFVAAGSDPGISAGASA